MCIDDLLDLFIDREMQKVEVYSLIGEKTIFDGYAEDMPLDILQQYIQSIDNVTHGNHDGKIVINVE